MFVDNNTLGSAFQYMAEKLLEVYGDREALHVASWCFEHRFGLSRADIVIKADTRFSESELLTVNRDVKALLENIPVQYVLGECEFFNLKINVDSSVLIPRPETEELVDWVLSDNKKEFPAVLDVGTGSGCIALALKSKLINAHIHGSDLSEAALRIAMSNGEKLGLDVSWHQGNILEGEPLVKGLDILISNPPYIPLADKKEMEDRVVEQEPHLALFTGPDSLEFYKVIATYGMICLKEDGLLYFEIHESKSSCVMELLTHEGYENVVLKKDFQGKDRMIRAEKE